MRSDNSNPGNIAIHGDHTTLYCKCDQASDMWQQLELAHERESDPEDTVGWSRKWLVDFNAGKTQLFSFDWSNNFGAIDVKMYESVSEEKSWDSFFPLNWIVARTLSLFTSLLQKLHPRNWDP